MLSKGSQWCRWEPHIHSPGTALNNQFRGADAWSRFLSTIESLTPPIRALGLTDYYLTENYQQLVQHKDDGRIPDVEFIFPNVEIRLDAAGRRGFINAHLLVNPADDDHLDQLERLLSRLSFGVRNDTYNCTRQDLVRLGNLTNPENTDDHEALRYGVTQFKVNFAELKRVIAGSEWAKNNVLVAVAGGSGDGTSSMREASDTTLRQEIEAFAHIIFSSSPSQRDFWLGRGACNVDEIRSRYRGLKLCLHGSDAHSIEAIGQAHEDRFSWLKGSLSFATLKQACIDPANRGYIAEKPPISVIPSEAISSITIEDADWFESTEIPLNFGLVSIIGARGSGKTALVEMIAAGCDSIPKTTWQGSDSPNSSFLARASSHLGSARVTLHWASDESECRHLDGRETKGSIIFPRARYLSQQFVTDLCTATEHPSDLSREIERVIFDSQPVDTTDGAVDFSELRELRTDRYQLSSAREAESIRQISRHISMELEKERLKDMFAKEVKDKQEQIRRYEADLRLLTIEKSDARIMQHRALLAAIRAHRKKRNQLKARHRTLLNLRDEVASMRGTLAPGMMLECQDRNPESGLSPEEWSEFILDYKGPVDEILDNHINRANEEIEVLTSQPSKPLLDDSSDIPNDSELSKLELHVLEYMIVRIERQLRDDRRVQDQYAALCKTIEHERDRLEKLESRLQDALGAAERRRDLQHQRNAAYERVFDAIIAEENELNALYSPLRDRLAKAGGTFHKLGISVNRRADAAMWAKYAEEKLLDRRLEGPFRGRGALSSVVESELKPTWETGTATEVKDSMDQFVLRYFQDFLAHAPVSREKHSDFRAWLREFAHWLYSTDHITVQYGVTYDNVDLDKLSPGTRGIILLLLYLALDDEDSRPLIIDQPEENLDPRSIFDELVPLFVSAKERRQVIIVTHNANLVVNTDSDQIIIAEANPVSAHALPRLTYQAGGLEDTAIRKAVCNILEGGEQAFQERARRMRLQLER
ncbi:MAG: AAA family ATPase [Rhodothermaceae bacterium]|nr:AAA family ATPase [Rhodothermaceae bacterium]MYC04577.1 AAA family ATPase [Rhodothermaceae bacterium]MYI16991.1 AAA family ATPase [Rhodothermaceae bacterium]